MTGHSVRVGTGIILLFANASTPTHKYTKPCVHPVPGSFPLFKQLELQADHLVPTLNAGTVKLRPIWCSGGGIAPPLLTLALDGGEWSASRPGQEPPSADLDDMEKRKSLFPTGTRSPAFHPVTILTELSPLGFVLTERCKTEALNFVA
jgi:hypothetical protein